MNKVLLLLQWEYRNNTNVNVESQALITKAFANSTGNITKSTYGNNDYIDFAYDYLDRVNSVSYNGTKSFKYDFDGNGNLGYSKDLKTGVSIRYIYDILDRLSKFVDSRGNAIQYTFDTNSNVTKVDETFNTEPWLQAILQTMNMMKTTGQRKVLFTIKRRLLQLMTDSGEWVL